MTGQLLGEAGLVGLAYEQGLLIVVRRQIRQYVDSRFAGGVHRGLQGVPPQEGEVRARFLVGPDGDRAPFAEGENEFLRQRGDFLSARLGS